jgi:Fic family protein
MPIFKAGYYKQQFQYKSFYPRLLNQTLIEISDKKIFSLVEEAGNILGKFNAYSTLFTEVNFFIQMHVIKEATTSSLIEGIKTNIDDILLPKDEIDPEKRFDWQEVQNFIKATNFAVTELNKLPLSMRLVNYAHKILLSGVRGKYKSPGEIRKSQNWIGGSSLKNAHFIPPHQDDLPVLLSDLEKYWHNDDYDIPFLIKVAISHYQFETIHPYLDGNGRIGRLLIILQFVERGLLKKPTLYLSEYFEKNRVEYYDSLSRVRIKNDIEQWISFFLNGVIETSKKGVVTFDKIILLQKNYKAKIARLGRRSELGNKLLNILFTKPIVNVNKIVEELHVTFPTANAIISDFEKIGIFQEVTGFARNRLFSFVEYINLFKTP